MEEKIDDVDISNNDEEVEDVKSETEREEEEESVEEIKSKLEESEKARIKAEENYLNQRIRAEKAEKGNKDFKPIQKTGELSTRDAITLMKANVPEEDIDEVVEYAKFKKLPLSDALKDSVVKSILADKAEMRRTAEASNTGSARRGSSKVSNESLLEKASKGEMPDSQEDIERLWRARKGL